MSYRAAQFRFFRLNLIAQTVAVYAGLVILSYLAVLMTVQYIQFKQFDDRHQKATAVLSRMDKRQAGLEAVHQFKAGDIVTFAEK